MGKRKKKHAQWEVIPDPLSSDGAHFSFGKYPISYQGPKLPDIHATFDFGKTHIPLAGGVGALVEKEYIDSLSLAVRSRYLDSIRDGKLKDREEPVNKFLQHSRVPDPVGFIGKNIIGDIQGQLEIEEERREEEQEREEQLDNGPEEILETVEEEKESEEQREQNLTIWKTCSQALKYSDPLSLSNNEPITPIGFDSGKSRAYPRIDFLKPVELNSRKEYERIQKELEKQGEQNKKFFEMHSQAAKVYSEATKQTFVDFGLPEIKPLPTLRESLKNFKPIELPAYEGMASISFSSKNKRVSLFEEIQKRLEKGQEGLEKERIEREEREEKAREKRNKMLESLTYQSHLFESTDPRTPLSYGLGTLPYRPTGTLKGDKTSGKALYMSEKQRAEFLRDASYLREARQIERSMAESEDVSAVERRVCERNSSRMTRLPEIGSLKIRI